MFRLCLLFVFVASTSSLTCLKRWANWDPKITEEEECGQDREFCMVQQGHWEMDKFMGEFELIQHCAATTCKQIWDNPQAGNSRYRCADDAYLAEKGGMSDFYPGRYTYCCCKTDHCNVPRGIGPIIDESP